MNNIKNYNFIKKKLLLSGTIKIYPSGYGLVFIENNKKINLHHQEIFIDKGNTGYALNKDKVIVYIIKNFNKRIEGKIVKIIKRNIKYIIGTIYLQKIYKQYYVIVKSISIHREIYIHINNIKNVKNYDKVIIHIINWPIGFSNPIGEIVEILGHSGNYNVEMNAILTEYNIPFKFSKEVIDEAKKIAQQTITKKDLILRKDMRNITTFTIDPIDAKDFDDAISFKQLDNEIMEIGIHIADVSFYIKENSLLDKEAYNRSNSIYLINYVIPMLPEIISNNICSLTPNEDKLTFSVIFKMNKKAEILNIWFGKTIINSNKRFTYEDVYKIIKDKKGLFYKEINSLNKLAKILKKKRIQRGSINIHSNEVKFIFSKKNIPHKIYIKDNNEANFLIEEFMLLVNNKVSEFLTLNQNLKNNISKNSFIYRIHDKPSLEKLQELKKILNLLGYNLNIKNTKNISHSLNKLLQSVMDKPEKNIINNLVMRSMSKASYSNKNIGHYGLALSYYTHFTSPIRRYPDILAHRLLQNKLISLNFKKKKSILINEKDHNHFIQCERLANEIERKSIKFIQIKYIKSFIGCYFIGVISGITDWSIYIEILKIKIDGMIRIKDIKNDKYIFNQKNYSIVGIKYGNSYHIGQKVKVKLIKINTEKNLIDLELIN